MYSHVVLFRIADPERIEEAAAMLRTLEGNVPSLRSVEVGVDDGTVTPVAGDDDSAEPIAAHCCRRSVNQITAMATANERMIAVSTPVRTPMPPLAPSARTRRATPGRR